MKETVKTSRTAGYLEKIFRALNAKYFNGELEEPIITIQSTPRAYGHVTVAKAWQRGDTTRHELNIGAGTLARPIENVVATTLHECVHLWNLQNGIDERETVVELIKQDCCLTPVPVKGMFIVGYAVTICVSTSFSYRTSFANPCRTGYICDIHSPENISIEEKV